MNNLKDIQNRFIHADRTILHSMKKMDSINAKLLLVFTQGKFTGVLSIGDIQKAIISNLSMDTTINNIIRKDFVFASITDDKSMVLELMKKERIECMPLLNERKDIVGAYLWNDIFQNVQLQKHLEFALPVVIMAGGKGARLKPLTNILPKPLIPIGEKTIIENIMDKFIEVGCNQFYISVNYKAEMIRHYFSTLENNTYQIEYLNEDSPLGTAGSLHLLNGKLNSTFFVSNCDIIINQDISEILEYHQSYKNEITTVAALKNYAIPYGIMETSKGGQLIGLTEKPDLTFKINTGFYVLEPHLIGEIPVSEFYHFTNLIYKLLSENRRVGVFPVSEKSWKDVGEWNEYKKYI